MKRVVVIGSNSFSGSDFIDLLLSETGYEVHGISRSEEKARVFLPYRDNERDTSRFHFHRLDLNHDTDRLVGLVDELAPAYIVNFAAQSEVAPSWEHPEHWFQTNVVALSKFINRLKERSYLEKYLHISSPEAYGSCSGVVKEDARLNPSTPYAVSKAAADMFLRTVHDHFRFPLVTVRSTNVYGAYQQLFKIIPRTIIAIKEGRRIPLHGGGVAVKSYIHIRDVSRGELLVMEQGVSGQLYHLSPDAGLAVRAVVETICRLSGRSFDEVVTIAPERLGQDAAYVIDSSLMRENFGWRPRVSFEEGVLNTIEWVERHWNIIKEHPHEYQHIP